MTPVRTSPYDHEVTRVPSRSLIAQDVTIALFVTVLQVQGVIVRGAEASERPLSDLAGLGVVLLVVPGVSLVVRRRWPAAVFVIAALTSALYYGLDYSDGPGWLALFVALYTLTAYGDGRRTVLVAATGITILAVTWLVAARGIQPPAAIGWVFFRIGASVMSAALGESVRARRAAAAEALERADLAERTRAEEGRARVDAERLRIAREVHDTVAHSLAIINVQAGVTAHILDQRPERAHETLKAIEDASSQTLQEMRAILGVLRGDHDDRAPHPGLDQVEPLAAKAREAGIQVDLNANLPRHPVPRAVDHAAYRILQEAVTNVIRHVGPTHVVISLSYDSDDVEVRVVDDGPWSHPPGGDVARTGDSGRGILGMRERCHLLGGEMTAGTRVGGGFEVSARLPLDPAGAVPR